MLNFREVAYAIFVCVASGANAPAAELVRVTHNGQTFLAYGKPAPVAQPRPNWEFELGARYWASTGKTKFDLFADRPGTTFFPISRLTYSNLLAHSGEVFGRVDHATGGFIKGFAGGGIIPGGKLRDEDFPPFIDPYSSTDSEQPNGKLAYGALDVGWSWRAERRVRVGIFAGYHHYFERVHAIGCTQTASNPDICVPTIPTSVLGITQESNWGAIRLGFSTEWWFAPGWKLTTDVAWLPYVMLRGSDSHHLRTDLSGATPERGAGVSNWQLEASLSYAVTDAFSVGIGARYWVFDSGPGNVAVHFEKTAVGGGAPQSATFKTERLGGFFQASYKFGHARPIQ